MVAEAARRTGADDVDEVEELMSRRIAERAFMSDTPMPPLVTAESEALVEAGVELAIEFAHGPTLSAGFILVEASGR